MSTRSSRLRRCTWLAICAMLAMTLLPTVSHALALWAAPAWPAEVCRARAAHSSLPGSPATWVQPVQAQPSPLARGFTLPGGWSGVHFEHCPYCAPSLGSIGPTPAAPMPALLPDGAAEAPAARTHVPQRLQPWTSAQPRAPPAPI